MTLTLDAERPLRPPLLAPPRRSAAPGGWEQAFAATALLLFAGAALPLLFGGANGDQSDLPSLALQGVLCGIALLLLGRTPGGIARAVHRLNPLVVALLGVIVLSTAWSVDPALTVRRACAVLGVTAFGLYLADRWSLQEQAWLVLQALGGAAVLSTVVVVLAPRYGVAPGAGGAWRGIFIQKNVLARVMVFGVLAGLLCAGSPGPRSRRVVAGGAALLCTGVLLRADSIFALGSLAVVLGLVAVIAMLRARFPLQQALGVLTATMVLGAVALLWLHIGAVLTAAGRDTGLTGRVPLWTSVIDAIRERPLLGYGYGAFWQGWRFPSTTVLLQNPWGPPHAHDGVLESALGIGVVGTLVWLAALGAGLRRGLRLLVRDRTASSAWPLGFVLLLVSFNVTEVTTPANACFWALFVAVSSSGTSSDEVGRGT